MKLFIVAIITTLAFLGLLTVPTGNINFPSSDDEPVDEVHTGFTNTTVDTLYWLRPAGLSTLTFALSLPDSADWASIILRRVYNAKGGRQFLAVRAGDTLSSADSIAGGGARGYSVTLAPLPDEYAVIIAFNNDGGGVQRGSDTTIVYKFEKTVGN